MKITISDNGNAILSFISEYSFRKGLKCNQEAKATIIKTKLSNLAAHVLQFALFAPKMQLREVPFGLERPPRD